MKESIRLVASLALVELLKFGWIFDSGIRYNHQSIFRTYRTTMSSQNGRLYHRPQCKQISLTIRYWATANREKKLAENKKNKSDVKENTNHKKKLLRRLRGPLCRISWAVIHFNPLMAWAPYVRFTAFQSLCTHEATKKNRIWDSYTNNGIADILPWYSYYVCYSHGMKKKYQVDNVMTASIILSISLSTFS